MTYKGSGHDHEHGDGRGPSRKLCVRDIFPNYDKGLPLGSKVLTADGLLPVEYLEPGDRVITRAGMRQVLGIDTPAPKRFKLSFAREEVIYADGVMVMSETGQPFAA